MGCKSQIIDGKITENLKENKRVQKTYFINN